MYIYLYQFWSPVVLFTIYSKLPGKIIALFDSIVNFFKLQKVELKNNVADKL
jgi:hypothetical protein